MKLTQNDVARILEGQGVRYTPLLCAAIPAVIALVKHYLQGKNVVVRILSRGVVGFLEAVQADVCPLPEAV